MIGGYEDLDGREQVQIGFKQDGIAVCTSQLYFGASFIPE